MTHKIIMMVVLLGCMFLGTTVSSAVDQATISIPVNSEQVSNQSVKIIHSNQLADNYNIRGIYYIRKQDYEQAKQDFLKAISLAETQADRNVYVNNLAMAYKNLGNYELALKTIDTVLASEPNMVDALDTKGDILIGLRRYDEAEEYLTHAILLNPDTGTSYYNRGRAYEALGEMGKAQADYQKAVTLRGDYQQEAKDKLQQINAKTKQQADKSNLYVF